MKLINTFIILLLVTTLLISCSKNENEIKTVQTDIYVAGTSNNKATLWKNGNVTILGENNSKANCVFVNGNDVYVGGYVQGNYPVIWKNGTQIILPTSSPFFISPLMEVFASKFGVTSIFVSGNDVYAVGTMSLTGGVPEGKIWKNSIEIPLLPNCVAANSIYIQGTDIYVVGESIAHRAILWKNGNAVNLAGDNYSGANSVYVSGNDVYVGGYEVIGGQSPARLWKNGAVVPFSNPTVSGKVVSVYNSGNDNYCVGYKTVDSQTVPVLWKNGIESTVTGLNTSKPKIEAVFALENDVYLTGVEDYVTHRSGAIWANGNPSLLSYGTNSQCNSIFVTRK